MKLTHKKRTYGLWLVVLLFAGVLLFLFLPAMLPGKCLFSNDGPPGMVMHMWRQRQPHTLADFAFYGLVLTFHVMFFAAMLTLPPGEPPKDDDAKPE